MADIYIYIYQTFLLNRNRVVVEQYRIKSIHANSLRINWLVLISWCKYYIMGVPPPHHHHNHHVSTELLVHTWPELPQGWGVGCWCEPEHWEPIWKPLDSVGTCETPHSGQSECETWWSSDHRKLPDSWNIWKRIQALRSVYHYEMCNFGYTFVLVYNFTP